MIPRVLIPLPYIERSDTQLTAQQAMELLVGPVPYSGMKLIYIYIYYNYINNIIYITHTPIIYIKSDVGHAVKYSFYWSIYSKCISLIFPRCSHLLEVTKA